jgi:hypothetical protein
MNGKLVRAKSVLWCSHCRIHRYVPAPNSKEDHTFFLLLELVQRIEKGDHLPPPLLLLLFVLRAEALPILASSGLGGGGGGGSKLIF